MTIEGKKFKRTGVATAVVTALCGTATLMLAQPAFAQAQGQTLQRVEVTGTNIRRTDTETASPVQVITKEEIDASGKGTVGEYLQTLTADNAGSVPTTYGRGFAGATASGISLRGLGANATLVLINGRRVAPAVLADDAQRTFVDLNSIPLEAVERVEVLKDGASAIYGSDAVAGVVNIILKKNYVGTTVKASYGTSKYSDGNEPRIAITHGFGDLDKDGFNLLLNLEAGKKEAIYLRDRTDRGTVGMAALTPLGFAPSGTGSQNVARFGGNGVLPTNAAGVLVNNSATQSFIGNVRNPTTLNYYSRGNPAGVGFTRTFPAAQTYCAANANLPQTDPGGGCVTDAWRTLGQVQPDHKNMSFYGRFTKKISGDTEAWAEVGYYRTESRVANITLNPGGTIFGLDGSIASNAAAFQLGAAHPDNPYFGTAARLAYLPVYDLGARIIESEGSALRFQTGVKGTMGAWEYDAAFSWSKSEQTDTQRNAINWRVANALINPTAANVAAARANSPAYAALPAGTVWRIGENANLNSPEMYGALLADQSRSGSAKNMALDGKVSREIGKLDGGPIGLAFGAELRKESNNLPFYSNLADHIGLSYTRYGGERNIAAAFAEVVAPVTKRLEANAAVRFDHYSDAGNAFTPKVGVTFRPADMVKLRGTYAKAFRAPTSTENSANSVAAFGGATVNDRVRTAAGVPNQNAVAPTFVQAGNPNLEPEKSTSATLGAVIDITPKTSLTADLFQIKRKGLPVIEDPQAAVDAGRVLRDPSTSTGPGDPGGIITGFVQFVNAAESTTTGLDVELKHRWDLGGGNGKVLFSGSWTHLFKSTLEDPTGSYDFAGNHGNCHITNCMGTPKDRISVAAAWDIGAWRLGGVVNYRGSLVNIKPEDNSTATCAYFLADGTTASPSGCKIKSFYTLDVNAVWKFRQNTEVFGSIQNLLDKKPPFDPTTYGAIGYNPLDYSGAIGRYFKIGVKHKF